MSEILPIEAMHENQHGRIVEIVGPMNWQHRLQELGLCEGKLVRLVKRGEPCILAIHDQRLSLRCEPGTMVLVEIGAA
ncbi:FeoA family protein [Planctomicrobium sp. SH668]|uniref:FeoA family protein n=1 Tax=Planctomicrobium sp. SH668 TaxID=3448126 RepID=UPI003F5BA20F